MSSYHPRNKIALDVKVDPIGDIKVPNFPQMPLRVATRFLGRTTSERGSRPALAND